MVKRGEIIDQAWHQIEPLLPKYGQSGGQWRDHRTVINAILWKLRTGSPWRDLPERYGPWQTCFDRFNRWRRDGTWDRLLAHAQTSQQGAEPDLPRFAVSDGCQRSRAILQTRS